MESIKDKYFNPLISWSIDHPRLAVGLAATGLSLVYYAGIRKSPNLPPGPKGWPIVGYSYSLSDNWHKDIVELRQQYGDIFTLYLPNKLIVLASYSAIKEVFITRGNDFADRPVIKTISKDIMDDEIFNAPYNEDWSQNKKFAVQAIRQLRDSADEKMINEINKVIAHLRKDVETPQDISQISILLATNIICSFLFSKRFDLDDAELADVVQMVQTWYTALNCFMTLGSGLPKWLFNIIYKKEHQNLKNAAVQLEEYIAIQVKQHASTFHPDDLRDFVDVYLARPGSSELGRKFYDTVLAVMPDSTDTMTIFLRWILLYVTLYPDVQQKMQQEIMERVGTGRNVFVSDRPSLPYTEAVILEVMRICDCSLFTGQHCPLEDTTLRGYDVPRDCEMIACLYAVHKDPELFPNPEQFSPERFIDESGNLVKNTLVIPFGIGRRMCLGESIAKMELFLVTANLVQAFNMTFPADEPQPSTEPVPAIMQYPQPYKIIFNER